MSFVEDLLGVMRGLKMVAESGLRHQQEATNLIWNNSSVKTAVQTCITNPPSIANYKPNPELFSEIISRSNVVIHGLRHLSAIKNPNYKQEEPRTIMDQKTRQEIDELNTEFDKTFASLSNKVENASLAPLIADNIVSPLEQAERNEKLKSPERNQSSYVFVEPKASTSPVGAIPKPVAKKKLKVSLSESSKPRVVPSSRIGRMFSFGSLFAGLGVGTVAQYARNTLQSVAGDTEEQANAFLSPANAERIVDTLCKVRGAALKLGQLLSIQDDSVMSPELQKIFKRVQQSADFMPAWQVDKVMTAQLGDDWRTRLQHFEEKPFAAASIGQVHQAVLKNGTEVAIKVQYPGVAKGINSDIDNLVGVMKIWNMFPKGMFVDNIVEVAKKELSWEVDYIREAECTRRFKRLLSPYPEYFVPDVIDELCAGEVMTTELIDGVPIDRMFDAPYETRRDIALKIMNLVVREMFVLRCMQTDPNWANFFYNPATKQVILLDFGATREYSKEFMDQYIEIIKAAADGDRATILRMSRDMKFLTGYETKIMEETHVDTVMILGEVFTGGIGDEEFDFSTQKTTRRIQALVPTILNHRLCPPPEEVYSLHRKLSGVFLLCSKMKVKMNCRQIFQEVYEQYKINSVR